MGLYNDQQCYKDFRMTPV